MNDLDQKAEALMETMRPVSATAGPGQNLLPPNTRFDVDFDSTSAPVWRAGDGDATLFVHGWDDTHRVWRPFAMEYLQRGKAVLLMDLPGHGASKDVDCTSQCAGTSVKAVMDSEEYLQAVIAHSFGCSATVSAIAKGADVPAIVLIAPPLPDNGRGWEARQRDNGVDEQIIQRAQEMYQVRHGSELRAVDIGQSLKEFEGRILLVGSENDEDCPIESIRQLAASLPYSEMLEVEHLNHRELAQDRGILSEIKAFLAG
jgi:pimeloyl-ACP methyl ester carboxylesterase